MAFTLGGTSKGRLRDEFLNAVVTFWECTKGMQRDVIVHFKEKQWIQPGAPTGLSCSVLRIGQSSLRRFKPRLQLVSQQQGISSMHMRSKCPQKFYPERFQHISADPSSLQMLRLSLVLFWPMVIPLFQYQWNQWKVTKCGSEGVFSGC